MTKNRWIGLIIGVAVFLAAFGAALAVTALQVSREIPSMLLTAQILPEDNLGLYNDPDGTDPVTYLQFILFQPPLARRILTQTIYVRNESTVN